MSLLYLLPSILLFTASVEVALRVRGTRRLLALIPAVIIATTYGLFAGGYIWIYPMRMGVYGSFALVFVGFVWAIGMHSGPAIGSATVTRRRR